MIVLKRQHRENGRRHVIIRTYISRVIVSVIHGGGLPSWGVIASRSQKRALMTNVIVITVAQLDTDIPPFSYSTLANLRCGLSVLVLFRNHWAEKVPIMNNRSQINLMGSRSFANAGLTIKNPERCEVHAVRAPNELSGPWL